MAFFPLTEEWSLDLDATFERQIEDGSLILTNEDYTIWVDIFDDDRPLQQKMASIKEENSPEIDDARTFQWGKEGLTQFSYFTSDEDDGWELTTFSIMASGYMLMSFYFDQEELLDEALKIIKTARFDEMKD